MLDGLASHSLPVDTHSRATGPSRVASNTNCDEATPPQPAPVNPAPDGSGKPLECYRPSRLRHGRNGRQDPRRSGDPRGTPRDHRARGRPGRLDRDRRAPGGRGGAARRRRGGRPRRPHRRALRRYRQGPRRRRRTGALRRPRRPRGRRRAGAPGRRRGDRRDPPARCRSRCRLGNRGIRRPRRREHRRGGAGTTRRRRSRRVRRLRRHRQHLRATAVAGPAGNRPGLGGHSPGGRDAFRLGRAAAARRPGAKRAGGGGRGAGRPGQRDQAPGRVDAAGRPRGRAGAGAGGRRRRDRRLRRRPHRDRRARRWQEPDHRRAAVGLRVGPGRARDAALVGGAVRQLRRVDALRRLPRPRPGMDRRLPERARPAGTGGPAAGARLRGRRAIGGAALSLPRRDARDDAGAGRPGARRRAVARGASVPHIRGGRGAADRARRRRPADHPARGSALGRCDLAGAGRAAAGRRRGNRRCCSS